MSTLAQIDQLNKLDIVLASASPRRVDLLANVGLRFRTVPSTFPETLNHDDFESPAAYALENARQKGLQVRRELLRTERRTPDWVIAADTIIVHNGKILEKPRAGGSHPTAQDAALAMLRALNGSSHECVTAVALWGPAPTEIEFCETTRIQFAQCHDAVLEEYVATGEPLDKAGGYGIQGLGALLVDRIEGCYFNVVGLPVPRLLRALMANRATAVSEDPRS